MIETNRRVAALLVAVLALTAGCTGAGGGADTGAQVGGDGQSLAAEREADTPMPTGTPVAEATAVAERGGSGDGAGGAAESSAARFAQRQLILTGEVAIEVEDFEAARRNLTRATERYGGFVSDTRQEVNRIDNQTWTEGMVVLRVPRENFTALYERAKAEGELITAQRNSRDVTDQLVDIQARLENLRAERDQLRELYERANTTEAILDVQERLSDVQGQIERLEARQQALRQRVALSTITVRIEEPRPEPDRPVPDRWYDVPLLAAFLESVNGVVVTLRAVAVAAAYAAPYLVAFGVPLAAVGYVLRRYRGRRGGGLRRRLSRGGRDSDAEPAPESTEDGTDDGDE
ncbi:MAG: DUF4349 domain-containing protein [Halobacteriales archaeon]